MSSKRLKKLSAELPQDDAELTALNARLALAQTSKEELIAARDKAFADIRCKLELEHGWDKAIAAHEETLQSGLKVLEAWSAVNHKRFGDARSIYMGGARFGWRLGNWKTSAAKKWELVTQKLKKWFDAGREKDASEEEIARGLMAADYLVFDCSPDKKSMLRDREIKERRKLLEEAGVEFNQEESFYWDPDRAGQDPARVEAA